jgi:hypothetical protein
MIHRHHYTIVGRQKSGENTTRIASEGNLAARYARIQNRGIIKLRKTMPVIVVVMLTAGAAHAEIINLHCELLHSDKFDSRFDSIDVVKIDTGAKEVELRSTKLNDGWIYANRPEDGKVGWASTILMEGNPDGKITAKGQRANNQYSIVYRPDAKLLTYVGFHDNKPGLVTYKCNR